MSKNIISKDQNTQTGSDAQLDVETLLRQSVLLPSQRKAFDRYLANSKNEDQKQEFQDVLKEIEREVLQTYEEYRYTGKPVSEFLKWKDKEIAPLAKVLTGRVNELSSKEFGEEEQDIGEAGRELPENADDQEEDQEEAEKQEKEEQEEKLAEEADAEQQTANGYTQEENEKWQASLERREKKQQEWEKFLQNRRDAEKQAERDEELFRDHPEYFSDPYQEEADNAEREAELEAQRQAEQAEFENRQYLDSAAREEQARYLRGSSHRQVPGGGQSDSNVAGIVISHKDNGDASYEGKMLQGMLSGDLNRASSDSSKSSEVITRHVSSDESGDSYDERVRSRTQNRMAQRLAAEKARKNGLVGYAGTAQRKNTASGYNTESKDFGNYVSRQNGNRNSVSNANHKGGVNAASKNQSSLSDDRELSSSPSAIIGRKKQEREITPTGSAAFSGDLSRSMHAVSVEEKHQADNIRTLKQDKTQIHTKKVSDREAAKQYAERIASAYKSGASVLQSHLKRSSGYVGDSQTAYVKNNFDKKVFVTQLGSEKADGARSGRNYGGATDSVGNSGEGGIKNSQYTGSMNGISAVGSVGTSALTKGGAKTGKSAANGAAAAAGKIGDVTNGVAVGGIGASAWTKGAVKAGEAAANAAAAGTRKIGNAAEYGAGGNPGSSSTESREIQQMTETSRKMREKIIRSAAMGRKTAARYQSAYKYSETASAVMDRKKPVNTRAGSVENASAQVRDGSVGKSVIRMTSDGFVKKSRDTVRKVGGSVAGGVTDGASIVGEGGVLTQGAGTVAQIGQMAARGAAAGMRKIGKAAEYGAGGNSGSSSIESKELQKMNSAARKMREKIIGSAGRAVGSSPGMKTAINASFRVVQKYTNAEKTGQGEGEEEDDKEGTSDDPKAVERIWRRNVNLNNAAKKKGPWKAIFGGGTTAGITRKIAKTLGSIGIRHPILLLIALVLVLLMVLIGSSFFLHQIDASFPASGRYSMTGEEVGDYLDDNATYATSDDGSGSIKVDDDTAGTWTGAKLTKEAGRIVGPSGGEETYYNQNMSGVVQIMRGMGNNDRYWVRDDGVKMLGDYVMVAANLSLHPRGSKVETSLGTGIVCDTGTFAASKPKNIDIATDW